MSLLDQFAKQPLSVKLVFLVMILFGILVGNYYLFYSPQKEQYTQLRGEAEKKRTQLIENKTIADNLPRFQEEVNILNEQLKQAIALLPNEANVHSLFRQLSIVAKKTNVEILTFRPGAQTSHGFYNDLGMDLRLDGTYHDIAIFIDQVGKLSRIINISNLVFSSPRGQGPSLLLTVDCRATTFLFGGGQ